MTGWLTVALVVTSSDGQRWDAVLDDVNLHRVDYKRAVASLARDIQRSIFGQERNAVASGVSTRCVS